MEDGKLHLIWRCLIVVLFAGIISCKANSQADTRSFSGPKPTLLQGNGEFRSLVEIEDWRSDFLQKDSAKSYSEIKSEIEKVKASVFSNKLSDDSLGALFTELLVFRVIPYWYGTPWTFEGHTSIPNQGEIACGYFVSTALLHAGLNINRYKLAQQLPVHEAASLALSDSVLIVSHFTTEEIIRDLELKTVDGVYFLGFDQSHVGFLFKREGQLYVIHSNYVGGAVAVELIEESLAFAAYRKFYICPLSTNKGFLKKWQRNEMITVIETP